MLDPDAVVDEQVDEHSDEQVDGVVGAAPVPAGSGPIMQGSVLGGEQVEGRAAVAALLRIRRRRARELWLVEGVDDGGLRALAATARVAVRTVRPDVFASTVGSSVADGVIALADPLAPADLGALLRTADQPATVVAIDGELGSDQLGAALAMAGARGADGVMLPRARAAPLTPSVMAAAAGAVETLPIVLVASLAAGVGSLRDAGWVVVGVEAGAAARIDELDDARLALASSSTVLVVATSAALSSHARARCDAVVGPGPWINGSTEPGALIASVLDALAARRGVEGAVEA